jgi:replicative DNA helicase
METNEKNLETFSTYEAEKAIAAALLKNELRAYDTSLNGFEFVNDFHRQVFVAVNQLTQDGSEADVLAVSNYLQGVMSEFDAPSAAELSNFAQKTFIPPNLGESIRLVKENAARNRLLNLARQVRFLAEKTDSRPADILRQAESLLEDVRKNLGVKQANRRHISEIAPLALERYEMMRRGVSYNIPTGIRAIDSVTRGGGSPGDVWIIGAFTGNGKSALALQIARNQANLNISSLVISREMLDIENFERIHSAEAGIPLWRVKPNMSETIYDNLTATVAEVANKPIWIDSTSSNIYEIRREIKDAARYDGVRVVFVDYLQLLEAGEGMRMNRTEEIAFCSKMLKRIAMENQIWVVALAQYNRLANYAGKGENHSFDGASQIEKDASIVLHLEIEPVPEGAAIPKWRRGNIRMGKARNAPQDALPIWFRGEVFTFQENDPYASQID